MDNMTNKGAMHMWLLYSFDLTHYLPLTNLLNECDIMGLINPVIRITRVTKLVEESR